MQYLVQLRKVLQSREVNQVAEILGKIEKMGFFAQKPDSAVALLFKKEVKVRPPVIIV